MSRLAIYAVATAVFLQAGSLQADSPQTDTPQTDTPQTEDIAIDVTKKDCARVEKHIARDDVNYKPGVDVRGKPVAPADLDDNRLKFPDKITIDLSLPLKDLFSRKNRPNRKLRNAEVYIGEIEFDIASGKVTFNGQELADPALNAIAIECRKIYAKQGS